LLRYNIDNTHAYNYAYIITSYESLTTTTETTLKVYLNCYWQSPIYSSRQL